MSAKFAESPVYTIPQHLRPSGSMNRLRGPKQVILDASGDGWVEQSPLGVCPPFANYPGSKLFICDLIYISVFQSLWMLMKVIIY